MFNYRMMRRGPRYWAIHGALAATLAACALGSMFLLDSLIGWVPLLLYGAMGLGYGHGLERAKCHQCDAQQNKKDAEGGIPSPSDGDDNVGVDFLSPGMVAQFTDPEQQRANGDHRPIPLIGGNAGNQNNQRCGDPDHIPAIKIDPIPIVRHALTPPSPWPNPVASKGMGQ